MRKWYNKEKLTKSELYILALIDPNIVKLEELEGDIVMEEYVDEAEDVALHNGFGESYDHEEANLEAFREIAFLKGMEEGKEKGLQQGIEQGIEQGIQQGKNQGNQDKVLS